MAQDNFTLKIYTPAGLGLEETVESVQLPTAAGQIGVLPGHITYTGLLGIGILSFISNGKSTRLVISGGFCSYNDGVFTVLADSIDLKDQVDTEHYADDRESLKKQIADGGPVDPRWVIAESQLKRIEAIDELISH